MKFVIVSYLPGMFGEFFSFQMVKESSNFVSANPIVDENNRFWYPNFLSTINLDCKNFSSDKKWPIDRLKLDMLETKFKDKLVCLPTHWYNDLHMTNLPCNGIRIYAQTIEVIKVSYVMWWLKSHIFANKLWPEREIELNSLIDTNVGSRDGLLELKLNFQNWKFLSYRNNYLVDNKPNLKFYLTRTYYRYIKNNFQFKSEYELYTAEKILMNNEEYASKNNALIKDKLGIYKLGDNFLNILYDYVKNFCE